MTRSSAIKTPHLLLLSLLFAARAAALPPVPQNAQGSGAADASGPRVEARLLVDAERVQPGAIFRAGVLFSLDPGWHIYWRNPGQSGLPTELEWRAAGARVGPIRWPAPAVFREADGFITTYGYADQVLLASELSFPAGASGERELAVTADFLACEVTCIPGRIELARSVSLGAPLPADPATASEFERWAKRVPLAPAALGVQLDALWSQSAIRPGDSFRGALALVSCADGPAECRPWRLHGAPADAFVPDALDSIELEATGSRPHPGVEDGALLLLGGRASPDAVEGEQRLGGVLALKRRGSGVQYVEVDVPLPRAPAGAHVERIAADWLEAPAPAHPGLPLWGALALALLGGLILNLMPCVLPVLAIKVFGIAESARYGRPELLRSAGAYTLGIESAMLALAFAVSLLRSAGTAVGWGFQFQEPLFIAALSAVLVVFALNLFGVFEIGVDAGGLSELSRRATGARRSFFEGVLAVVLATPCSAPFLGTAVGFAFASPAAVGLAIFLAVGLGLALPYLAIAAVPGWARWLPRPGAWMLQLRRLLGFAVLATVVWLLSIPSSAGAVVALLAWLVAIALGTWIAGSLQAAGRRAAARGAFAAVALGALAAALVLPLDASVAPDREIARSDSWRPFDPQAIRAELEGGRAVFVDFTADWCLTCKANEQLVLADARVEAEFERLDVARFKADWTRRDERIRAELAAHGRAGVPLYLVYSPHAPEKPSVLPELLTIGRVLEALRAALPSQPTEEKST
jgi:thiol:disulfide interchange protein DsbD